MGKLTTHVLDVSHGKPVAGIQLELFLFNEGFKKIYSGITNDDGRTDEPLLINSEVLTGVYELIFEIGPYFKLKTEKVGSVPFLDKIPVRFGIDDANQNFHVPLLVSPFGYSTYRGS